ncbi:MAG TPA: hypothetical protein DCL38_03775, partial [Lachnospiraceae bacterium]|nr:hypothetical protein [Lachnospiraceae bacterium]
GEDEWRLSAGHVVKEEQPPEDIYGEIAEAARDMDYVRLEESIRELEERDLSEEERGLSEGLRECLEAFDFDGILDRLKLRAP